MKTSIFILIGILIAMLASAQRTDTLSLTVNGARLHCVLSTPNEGNKAPLALIIAGSGPTDLNGNNQMMKNNSLRYLSDALLKNNIATLRFDKYGIAKSAVPGFNESSLTIDRYASDVTSLFNQMKDRGFTNIYLVGHSEGSLIGLIALQTVKAKGFVSVAGAGFPADEILKKQLKPQLPPDLFTLSSGLIDSLKNGHLVSSAPQMLYSLFRPSVQPYMISWLKYEPVKLISKVACPTLIVQGDKDLQITPADAQNLAQASPNGKLEIIEGMNHIFKDIKGDTQENLASYNNPDLPVNSKFAQMIVNFIHQK